ncbi:hypothetical protein Tco_0404774 [Tanacetum coccineum]
MCGVLSLSQWNLSLMLKRSVAHILGKPAHFVSLMASLNSMLPTSSKRKLQGILRSNADVFAWNYVDMMGIPRTIMEEGKHFNTEHKLNEYKHIEPVKQKKCGLAPEQNEAACKEVDGLTKAGILREVKYHTWVAIPVMVKKSDEGWRMCVDFMDINKACPKDCYPLPEIDPKVEPLSGFRLNYFLDAYKGYHQIKMAEGDKDKTTSSPERDYSTTGRCLLTYVDDMVIKSAFKEDMLMDIQDIFDRLRSINLKLNPKKCSFGVEEGPFLRHLITKQGIRANPLKVKEITNLKPPRTLKEIQSLNAKLAALSRFLSKGADRSLPFFKALKSYINKKTIQWTADAEEAF